MKKENASHPVQIVLRDWSKANKANHPIAETHTKRKETKNGRS